MSVIEIVGAKHPMPPARGLQEMSCQAVESGAGDLAPVRQAAQRIAAYARAAAAAGQFQVTLPVELATGPQRSSLVNYLRARGYFSDWIEDERVARLHVSWWNARAAM